MSLEEYVGPLIGIVRQGNRRPAQRPYGLKRTQEEDAEGVNLGKEKTEDKKDVQSAEMAGRIVKVANNLHDAPVPIAESTEHGEHHQCQRDEIGV